MIVSSIPKTWQKQNIAILIIAFIIFVIANLVLITLLATKLKFIVLFAGLWLGFSFGLANFWFLNFGVWVVLKTFNKFLSVIFALLRIIILAIPIILAMSYHQIFNPYSCIIGIYLLTLAVYFSNINFSKLRFWKWKLK